jgi:hypothetical protein
MLWVFVGVLGEGINSKVQSCQGSYFGMIRKNAEIGSWSKAREPVD